MNTIDEEFKLHFLDFVVYSSGHCYNYIALITYFILQFVCCDLSMMLAFKYLSNTLNQGQFLKNVKTTLKVEQRESNRKSLCMQFSGNWQSTVQCSLEQVNMPEEIQQCELMLWCTSFPLFVPSDMARFQAHILFKSQFAVIVQSATFYVFLSTTLHQAQIQNSLKNLP